VAAGVLSLALGAERFLNVLLVDGAARYASTRFVVAAACTAVAGVLFACAGLRRRKPRGQ